MVNGLNISSETGISFNSDIQKTSFSPLWAAWFSHVPQRALFSYGILSYCKGFFRRLQGVRRRNGSISPPGIICAACAQNIETENAQAPRRIPARPDEISGKTDRGFQNKA
jgi:hypothetical protein